MNIPEMQVPQAVPEYIDNSVLRVKSDWQDPPACDQFV